MTFKDNDKAIYLQIADGICDSVLAGSLNPGDRIPSVREYAARMGVNANTVMRSYDYLDQKGIIFNKRGIGFFISPDAFDKIRSERRDTFFNVEADAYFQRMAAIGLTPGEVATLYSEYLNKNKQ
ncbi:MAG: GntR family transcriptional regulator [Duncaniella sp.]|nr:GntR family transcriptional regulator [Duncaniella sp.]